MMTGVHVACATMVTKAPKWLKTTPDSPYGQITPFNRAVQSPRHERIVDCAGCGHQAATLLDIYTCEYCGRKA